MTQHVLSELLEAGGYVDVADLAIERCRVDTDAHGQPFHPRDHQLFTLRGRLRGCELKNPHNRMVPHLKKWIAEFESVPSDTPIYFWEGFFGGKRLVGRCSDTKILQIFPQDE